MQSHQTRNQTSLTKLISPNKNSQAVKVFYSYSHVDEEFRNTLETHLSILRRKGHIDEWHDRKIIPGKEWGSEIDSKLSESDLILLLISPDFIASEYCYSIEMERAMELHESGNTVVVPIVVRPAEITDEPFARIQMLPTDKKPITLWENYDVAWMDVTKGLKKTIENIQENNRRSFNSDSSLKDMRSILTEEVERIDAAFESEDDVCSGIATGFYNLDEMLDGMHGSDFWIIAARPQMGKTDLALNILAHMAVAEKIPVAFFSTQLPSSKVIRRLISSLGRIDSYHQLKGALTDEDWPRMTSAVRLLAEADKNIFINDKPEISITELSESVRELHKKHGIGVLIIDGLQNVVMDYKNKYLEPEKVSRLIKNLAREIKLPVISTLPISRELERRFDKRPLITDLGVWDSLNVDADNIMFIYRDEIYNWDSPDRGMAEIIVAKNNNGPIGRVRLTYFEKYYKFENFIPETYITDEVDVGHEEEEGSETPRV